MYGIIDLSMINTAPGSGSPFAPPSGFAGDYREYMRERWRKDPAARQRIAVTGRLLVRGEDVRFLGPYAEEARRLALDVWGVP